MPRRRPHSLLRAALARLARVTRWAATHRVRTSRHRPATATDVRPPAAWTELVARRAPQLLTQPGPQASGARRGKPQADAPTREHRTPRLPLPPVERHLPEPTWPVAGRRATGTPRFPQDTPRQLEQPTSRWPSLPDEQHHGREPVFNDSDRGLWPALPDDAELWLVPHAALTESHLRYLDQEQEGRPWNE